MMKLRKIHSWYRNLKGGITILYIRYELFNPFAKSYLEEILPKFEVIPRIGIGIRRDIRRGDFESLSIILGWLNFYIEFSINWFKKS